MAQIRSNRRSSVLRGNVGVLPFPKSAAVQASAQSSTGWLLSAVALIAAYLLVRTVLVQRLSALPAHSTVPAGTILTLDGQPYSGNESSALAISQPSIQAERLQGSSADSYFQPTGGGDVQSVASGDSLQMTQSSYNQQGSVGTSRR